MVEYLKAESLLYMLTLFCVQKAQYKTLNCKTNKSEYTYKLTKKTKFL